MQSNQGRDDSNNHGQNKKGTRAIDEEFLQFVYNKENNGNGSDSESFLQGAVGVGVGVRVQSSLSTASTSELLSIQQECWSKQQRQSSSKKETTPASYAMRRKGSDMKYSSVSPPERRCASARTITNQECFTATFDESVEETSLSSESYRIMEEMNIVYEASPMLSVYIKSPRKNQSSVDEVNRVYEKSPMPLTYMNSPSKTMSVEEINSVYQNSPIQTRKNKASVTVGENKKQSTVPKKRMNASIWLSKNQSTKKSSKTMTISGISLSTAKAYGRSMSVDASSRRKHRASRSSLSGAPNTKALAVQREEQQRHKMKTEADSNETRTCLDKRTARLRYGNDFQAEIEEFRSRRPHLNSGPNHTGSQKHDRSLNGVSIVVRKRPIFDFERKRGDYDVVSIDNSSSNECIIHNCIMHSDMKRKLVKTICFPAHATFDEHCSNDDIYRKIVEPLLNNAMKGVVSTILLYGQTGCGKTYTMQGIEERLARDIFQAIASQRASNNNVSDEGQQKLTLQFVELRGSKEISDLLCERNKGVVKLVDDDDGSCHLLNATSLGITSPELLLQKISEAKSRRATEATDKNGVSSRSHSCCQIRITGSKGVLTLIDLAGSERRHDSLYHSVDRQKESAEINASLFALKECVRARACNSPRVPFRNHNLTRLLRESFETDGARLCVIACVSPCSTDTEHSIETLRFATSIVGADSQIREGETRIVQGVTELESRFLSPKQWDNEKLQKFLLQKKMDKVRITNNHDGKILMKMSVQQMRTHLFDVEDSELAKKLFDLLRLENDRVSELQRADRIKLSKARKGIS